MERRNFLKSAGALFGTSALAGSAQASSGPIIVGFNTDRHVSTEWDTDDFNFVRAKIHDQSILNGFEVYVSGRFSQPVQNEDVTVTLYSDKDKKLKEKNYTVNGSGWKRIPNVWRYPATVKFER